MFSLSFSATPFLDLASFKIPFRRVLVQSILRKVRSPSFNMISLRYSTGFRRPGFHCWPLWMDWPRSPHWTIDPEVFDFSIRLWSSPIADNEKLLVSCFLMVLIWLYIATWQLSLKSIQIRLKFRLVSTTELQSHHFFTRRSSFNHPQFKAPLAIFYAPPP